MLYDCPYKMNTMNTKALHPHPLISLLPLAVLIALIALVLRIFPDDALSGASQVALMVASSVCVALSMLVYKTKWTVFEEMIKKTVGDAGVSILILLLIGMMSATWMVSGVVAMALSALRLHYFLVYIGHHRHFVDYYCHNRHCPYGHWRRLRHSTTLHGGGHHIGRLLWRQNVTHERHHRVGLINGGRRLV